MRLVMTVVEDDAADFIPPVVVAIVAIFVSVVAAGAVDEQQDFLAKYPVAPSSATFNTRETTRIGFEFMVSKVT